jgi:hypothetical protein
VYCCAHLQLLLLPQQQRTAAAIEAGGADADEEEPEGDSPTAATTTDITTTAATTAAAAAAVVIAAANSSATAASSTSTNSSSTVAELVQALRQLQADADAFHHHMPEARVRQKTEAFARGVRMRRTRARFSALCAESAAAVRELVATAMDDVQVGVTV